MFEGLKTWNPWFGCKYDCYRCGCWARRRLAHRLGKMLRCQECYHFLPHFHPERLDRIPSNPRIFVVAHGDLFGAWVPTHVIGRILKVCRENRKECWFFETKNPLRYLGFFNDTWTLFPINTVLSTTIETNRTYPMEIRGHTPRPKERFDAILEIRKTSQFPIHISIEPVMDFDLDVLVSWIKELNPVKILVGYDSLKNNLPEPPKAKTFRLIEELEKFTGVERKQL